jgi:uncharacterized protein YraI
MRSATLSRLWLGGVLMLVFSATALAENAVTADVASVRAGPDESYPEVAQLDADSPIQVMGCLDDWSWCDVTFGDNRGWLYAPDISYEYEGGYVPFYTYAPAFGLPVITFSLDAYWGSHYRDRPWYGRRDEWVHRSIHHQRPPGPAPSHAPPPREIVRAERPHSGARPGEPSLHLSQAEPGHSDDDRARGGRAPDVERAPERRASPELRPQERSTLQQERTTPQEHAMPQERAPQGRAEPPHAERAVPSAGERAKAPEHIAPQREEQRSHSAERSPVQRGEAHGAGPRAEPAPHRDENDHRG